MRLRIPLWRLKIISPVLYALTIKNVHVFLYWILLLICFYTFWIEQYTHAHLGAHFVDFYSFKRITRK